MKYVKLTAENYNEALQQLRTKYGEDAIPISHKYVKEGGFFNSKLFAKEIVELTAAIHEKKMDYFQKKRKPTIDLKADEDISDTVRGRLGMEREGALPERNSTGFSFQQEARDTFANAKKREEASAAPEHPL